VEAELCFVLMPFGPPDLQSVYADHVKPTLMRAGLRVDRADDIYGVQPIMDDVWVGINRARLIVAGLNRLRRAALRAERAARVRKMALFFLRNELTGRNPNVMYELGISHTLGKDTILLTQTMDDVPFDLRHRRAILYAYNPRGCKKLEAALKKTVLSVLERTT
jgi:hypothetical protein